MTRTLRAVLITLGDPTQLTGGYLFHQRLAQLAPAHAATLEFVSFPERPFPWGIARRARGSFARSESRQPDAVIIGQHRRMVPGVRCTQAADARHAASAARRHRFSTRADERAAAARSTCVPSLAPLAGCQRLVGRGAARSGTAARQDQRGPARTRRGDRRLDLRRAICGMADAPVFCASATGWSAKGF